MVTRSETQLVTLTIDDRKVTVPAGTYILQAAEAAGIEVPNLCFQPLLRPWGSCRLCTVEILGERGGLIESCATPVRDGMEVLTLSQRVVEARQFILQMYLIDHALDCPTCDKSGECYLQDNTYLHNVDRNPYRRPKLAQPYKHFSDFIDYKWDRCIVCSRCTRVCDEMVGVTAITVAGRSLEAEITPAYGIDLSETTCTNCGMCIAVCPVGALTDRHFGHHPWELDTVETICGMCDVGCTINVEHNRGIVRRTSHLWNRGVNLGYTCELGRWGHEHVQDPTRLIYPMIREGDDFIDVELDEALDLIANRLRNYQGSSFAALSSPDNTNEENYSMQQFTRAVMGSNNIDRLTTHGQSAVDEIMTASFGTTASSAGMQEAMTNSNAILVIGPNIEKVAPIASYWLYWAQRYREATIIVVSEDHNALAERSNHWIPAKGGSEQDVLNVLAKIIIDEGLAADSTAAMSFQESLHDIDTAAVASAIGISVDDLRDAAILYATGGAGISADDYPSSAIWHTLAASGKDSADIPVAAAHNLAILCDNLGKPGGGILALRGRANMQGATDVGCHPEFLPGGSSVKDDDRRKTLEQIWSHRWNEEVIQLNGFKRIRELPKEPGISTSGLVQAIKSGEIKAMYVSAQSHRAGESKDQFFSANGPIFDTKLDADLLQALASLEFLVVEDCFSSELTAIADIVLPVAMYLEKDGTFTSVDRTIQRARYVVAPPGDAAPSTWFLAEIARRLGYSLPASNPSSVFDEICQLVPNYAGASYPRLERGGLQWPVRHFSTSQKMYLSVNDGLTSENMSIVSH